MINILIPSTPARGERLEKSIKSIRASVCDQPIEIFTEISKGEGAVKPMLRLLDKIDGLVMPFSDDMWVTPNAIQHLYDNFITNFPEQDGISCPLGMDIFITHSSIMKKYWHPGYFHLFCDREFFEIMHMKGKICRVKNAQIVHEHYSFNATFMDETYDLTIKHRDQDQKLYHERLANNFYLD